MKIITIEVSSPIEVGGGLGVGVKVADIYHFVPIRAAEALGLTMFAGSWSPSHTIFLRVGTTYDDVAQERPGPGN